MIVFDNICQAYRNSETKQMQQVLDGVSFTAKKGMITALLGPNGAGKTTLVKILAGLITPQSGLASIENCGHNVVKKIGFFTDTFGLYPKLTALENIQYFADLHACKPEDFKLQLTRLSVSLNLDKLLDKTAAYLSQGERMRVSLARTLIHNPDYLVLDEPTNGLDIMSVIELRHFLKQLITAEHGEKCILYSSHVMSEVVKLADHIVILANGKIRMQGTHQNITQSQNAQDFEEAFIRLITGQDNA